MTGPQSAAPTRLRAVL